MFLALFRLVLLQAALQDSVEFRLVERLCNVIERTELNRLHDRARITHAGKNNNLLLRTNLFAFLDRLQPIHAGHRHIEKNQAGTQAFANPLDRFETAVGGFDCVVIHLEQSLGVAKHARFIINNQNGGIYAHCCSFVLIGRSKENVLPLPGSLSTQILPPCASIKRRAMASPSPMPWESEVCCNLRNSLKISW